MFLPNNFTQYAEDALFNDDPKDMELPGKWYMEELKSTKPFARKLREYVASKYGFTEENDDALIDFLYPICKQEQTGITKANLKSWLQNIPRITCTKNWDDGRDKIYQLCFALHMTELETTDFFLKAILERPFNFKDLRDTVYYFAFKNGLRYPQARELLAEAAAIPFDETANTEIVTKRIQNAVSGYSDRVSLLAYITENRYSFELTSSAAAKKIRDLLPHCYSFAEKEYLDPKGKRRSVKNIDDLLSVIYDYPAREKAAGQSAYSQSISKSDFPDLIKKNFPQREQFKNIEAGKASYDVLRKALLILQFYYFFADEAVNGCEDPSKSFDTFHDETNESLEKCGFSHLYWANPYDWFIGHCAASEDPLSTLRDNIAYYYIDRVIPDISDEEWHKNKSRLPLSTK